MSATDPRVRACRPVWWSAAFASAVCAAYGDWLPVVVWMSIATAMPHVVVALNEWAFHRRVERAIDAKLAEFDALDDGWELVLDDEEVPGMAQAIVECRRHAGYCKRNPVDVLAKVDRLAEEVGL